MHDLCHFDRLPCQGQWPQRTHRRGTRIRDDGQKNRRASAKHPVILDATTFKSIPIRLARRTRATRYYCLSALLLLRAGELEERARSRQRRATMNVHNIDMGRLHGYVSISNATQKVAYPCELGL